MTQTTELDLTLVDKTIAECGGDQSAMIPLLRGIQDAYGYLPAEALEYLSKQTGLALGEIYGVATFYSQFRHRPAGKHTIAVCHGTACHVKGAQGVTDAVRRYLNIVGEDDTDADGLFTVEKVACLGCCTLAPAVKIDEVTYGHLTPATVGDMIQDFIKNEASRKKDNRKVPEPTGPAGQIRLGLGSCCVSRGSGKVKQAVDETLMETHAPVKVKRVGCVGMCHETPLVDVITPDGQLHRYAQVDPQDARRIVLKHFAPQGPLRKVRSAVTDALQHMLTDENWRPVERYVLPPRDPHIQSFLGPQEHITTELFGEIDPGDIDEYIAAGGFEALRKVINESSPAEVIEQIQRSGLRGRGGAGFPTGVKWQHVRNAAGDVKYVVCNGDEGDPGAFMDRMLLESFPHRILEGMAIAAWAVGAHEGVLYIRAEYPLAVERVQEAIEECKQRGYLGENVMGTGFSLELRIMEGAGAFVCGEETALLASIEGKRGMPRYRPPYPANKGLWGKPTLVNNVESYATVAWILRHGVDTYIRLGTERSRGTKVFALAGKIERGGLIEVPMGITIREVVNLIGGGVPNGKKLKAVQIGGPSGGCVPESLADTPVDFEALGEVGAMMGSGGLVVLDEDDCMVDIARYFLSFTQEQSCGKCTFCRIGTRHMLDILERLCVGEGKQGDVEKLEELAATIARGSMCQLGGTAPNPVLSTIRYFRDEYEAHIEGRCPAGKCPALISYHINEDCIGCTLCAQQCPTDAIEARPHRLHEVDQEKCVRCDGCRAICPVDAVVVKSP